MEGSGASDEEENEDELEDELEDEHEDETAMEGVEAARMIDEQSPDEDERQALQSLRTPIRSTSKRVILSGVSL
jgi:hypothetical protein